MPTQKPRTMITFNDKELYERVNTFRFEGRYKSQNDAISALIEKGIEALTGEELKPKREITDEDEQLLNAYHAADPLSRLYAMHILQMEPPKKKKNRE